MNINSNKEKRATVDERDHFFNELNKLLSKRLNIEDNNLFIFKSDVVKKL
jgi:hypothetical protein